MRAELARLGCDPDDHDEDHPDTLSLTTLWDELFSLAGPG
jgi:hypothetical protein